MIYNHTRYEGYDEHHEPIEILCPTNGIYFINYQGLGMVWNFNVSSFIVKHLPYDAEMVAELKALFMPYIEKERELERIRQRNISTGTRTKCGHINRRNKNVIITN